MTRSTERRLQRLANQQGRGVWVYARGAFLHISFGGLRRGLPRKGWSTVAVVCQETVLWEVV